MNALGQNVSLVAKTDDGVGDVKKGKNTAITQAMARREMTQTDLAEVTGIHLTTINAVVNGTVPRADNAIRIARALKVSVEELWGHMVVVRENGGMKDGIK